MQRGQHSQPQRAYERNPRKDTSKMARRQRKELQMSYINNERERQEERDDTLLKPVPAAPTPASLDGPVAYAVCGRRREVAFVDPSSDTEEVLHILEGYEFESALVLFTHAGVGDIGELPLPELLERHPVPVVTHSGDPGLFEQNKPLESSWSAMGKSCRIFKKLNLMTPVFPGPGEAGNLRDECRNNGWLRSREA